MSRLKLLFVILLLFVFCLSAMATMSASANELWSMPEPYIGEALWLSEVGNNGGLATSENGTLYLRTWGLAAGVSIIDLETAEVTRLFDISPTAGTSDIVGGPDDTVFMNVVEKVRQISPDGSYTVWGVFPNEFIVAYTPDGKMLGRSHDGSNLYELYQDGSKSLIASGFHNIYDVCVTQDGIIFVYEWNTGNVVRVEPDGSKRILVESVMPGDFANLGLDFDGQLYINSAGVYGFKRVDMDTGELTDIPNAYNECVWNPNDYVFIEPGKIILTGDQLTWADINAGTNGIIIQNIGSTYAADIGPDNALYIGVSDSGDSSGQIRRIADDGTQSVHFDHIKGVMERIAITPDGYVYAITKYSDTYHLLFINPMKGTQKELQGLPQDGIMQLTINPKNQHAYLSLDRGQPIYEFDYKGLVTTYNVNIPWDAHEYRIDFAPDGTLYAYIGCMDNGRDGPWIVQINLNNRTCTQIAELPCASPVGLGAFCVSPDETLWIYINPESVIYNVTPEGDVTVFAKNLPIDAPAIAVAPDDNIYFTCSSGLFHIFKEQ